MKNKLYVAGLLIFALAVILIVAFAPSIFSSIDYGVSVQNVTGYSSCYQESATIANQAGNDGSCSLSYSGSYGSNGDTIPNQPPESGSGGNFENYSKLNDGNFDTYSPLLNDNNNGVFSNLVVTYIKPSNVVATNWTIKDANGTRKVAIPTNCLNYSLVNLTLGATQRSSLISSSQNGTYWYCRNSTGFQIIANSNTLNATSGFSGYLYEEGVNWTIASYETITIYQANRIYIIVIGSLIGIFVVLYLWKIVDEM